jgi:hypothetical protein
MKNAATAKTPSERAKLGAFLPLSVAINEPPPLDFFLCRLQFSDNCH